MNTPRQPAPFSSSPIRVLYAWDLPDHHHLRRVQAVASHAGIEVKLTHEREVDDDRPGAAVAAEGSFEWLDPRTLTPATLAPFDAVIMHGHRDPFIRHLLTLLPRHIRRFIFISETGLHRCNPLRRYWRARRLAAFDGALVPGRMAYRSLKKLGFAPNRIDIVGLPPDDTALRVARKRAHTATEFLGAIVFVGRLVPERNLAALIEGYALARQHTPHLPRLVIAGTGPLEAELQQQARRLGLDDSAVAFLGATSPLEVPRLMAGAAFVVRPSLLDNWGITIQEAMHAGRPVLASLACGCLPELLHSDCAFLLRGFRPADIAEGLTRTWANRQHFEAMGKAAITRAEIHGLEAHGQAVVKALRRSLWGTPIEMPALADKSQPTTPTTPQREATP